jgi:hypothetical protein
MRMIKGVLLGALLVAPVMGLAQGSDTNIVWKRNITLGATYRDGNTDRKAFIANLKVDRTSEISEWISSLYSEYGKTDGDRTEGKSRLQSEYRYKFGNKDWYAGIFSEAYNDDIRGIRYRVKMGPNIGYYFINDEKMKLDFSLGYNAVYEKNVDEETGNGEFRVAGNYLWDINENASYYFNIEYVADSEDANDGNGLLVTGLRSKVNNQLSMTIELRDEYDNMPASGSEYNDVIAIAGLTYDF